MKWLGTSRSRNDPYLLTNLPFILYVTMISHFLHDLRPLQLHLSIVIHNLVKLILSCRHGAFVEGKSLVTFCTETVLNYGCEKGKFAFVLSETSSAIQYTLIEALRFVKMLRLLLRTGVKCGAKEVLRSISFLDGTPRSRSPLLLQSRLQKIISSAGHDYLLTDPAKNFADS
mmetsp:Transcript_20653/g.43404  ORF Transcript_20653/g.43404 Transcript_20653/m.43404 type:complete len:172 (-) Transcript_20653:122-637(-)